MSDWDQGWPGWQDDGKRVEIHLRDGSIVQGSLTYEDFSAGPDEVPYWQIKNDDGRLLSFAIEQVHWRFI